MTQFSPAELDSHVLVSVIVPVFNTAQELIERAVASALAQTHPHLELLIVDDGSTAEIAEFIDLVAERDPRIQVLRQPNGGVSSARNTGVERAKGEFIAYLDADDYLEPGFLTAALAIARTAEADVVFGGMRVLHGLGTVDWRTGGPTAIEPLLASPEAIVTACVHALASSPSLRQPTQLLSVTNVLSCIYRAKTTRRHPFPEGVSHAEDRLHNVQVLLDVDRAAFCSDVWYVYDTTHELGATRRATHRTVAALSRTVREYAGVTGGLDRHGLSKVAFDRIGQAAADGVLNYLKMQSGVMAAVGGHRANRKQLRQLLADPSVIAATERATQRGWQDQIFASAARRRYVEVLLVFGWLWVRRRGLQMSVEKHRRSSHGGQHDHD